MGQSNSVGKIELENMNEKLQGSERTLRSTNDGLEISPNKENSTPKNDVMKIDEEAEEAEDQQLDLL